MQSDLGTIDVRSILILYVFVQSWFNRTASTQQNTEHWISRYKLGLVRTFSSLMEIILS